MGSIGEILKSADSERHLWRNRRHRMWRSGSKFWRISISINACLNQVKIYLASEVETDFSFSLPPHHPSPSTSGAEYWLLRLEHRGEWGGDLTEPLDETPIEVGESNAHLNPSY